MPPVSLPLQTHTNQIPSQPGRSSLHAHKFPPKSQNPSKSAARGREATSTCPPFRFHGAHTFRAPHSPIFPSLPTPPYPAYSQAKQHRHQQHRWRLGGLRGVAPPWKRKARLLSTPGIRPLRHLRFEISVQRTTNGFNFHLFSSEKDSIFTRDDALKKDGCRLSDRRERDEAARKYEVPNGGRESHAKEIRKSHAYLLILRRSQDVGCEMLDLR